MPFPFFDAPCHNPRIFLLQSYNLHGKFLNPPRWVLYSTSQNINSTSQNNNSTSQNIYSVLQNKELNMERERIIHGEGKKNPSGGKELSVVREKKIIGGEGKKS